jgi:AcrR family transcriptional regulator
MARTPKVVEDRRAQILDAAMRAFAQKGFSRATNKIIAQEANITPGLIYHYFESKEALLKAIIEERSPAAIVRSLPPEVFTWPPEKLLRFLVPQILDLVEGEGFVQLVRVLVPEMIHNPAITPLGATVIQQVTAIMEKYFTQKIADGELVLVDVRMAVHVLIGSLISFVLRRQVLRDPSVAHYTHVEIAEAISEIVLKGLIPR